MLVVHEHSAGAALGAIAHSLGAGDLELIAERVEQGDTGLKLQSVFLAVDGELDRHFARTINLYRFTSRLHDFGSENRHGCRRNGGNFQEVAAGNAGVVVNRLFEARRFTDRRLAFIISERYL